MPTHGQEEKRMNGWRLRGVSANTNLEVRVVEAEVSHVSVLLFYMFLYYYKLYFLLRNVLFLL